MINEQYILDIIKVFSTLLVNMIQLELSLSRLAVKSFPKEL